MGRNKIPVEKVYGEKVNLKKGLSMASRLTFITPTYRDDFEQFCLQRESFEKWGIEIPHVAVVHHEDLPLFKDIPFTPDKGGVTR